MQGTLLKGTMAELDLIERHLHMLKATRENQPIGIIRLSEITGIPRHKVRYSLRLLEKDGLIIPTPEGATVSDRYEEYIDEVEASLTGAVERADSIRETLHGRNRCGHAWKLALSPSHRMIGFYTSRISAT